MLEQEQNHVYVAYLLWSLGQQSSDHVIAFMHACQDHSELGFGKRDESLLNVQFVAALPCIPPAGSALYFLNHSYTMPALLVGVSVLRLY